MGLLKRFTLKQLLITLQILAFIPWLLGLFIGFYFIYPEIKEARVQLSAEKDLLIKASLVWNLQKHRGLSLLHFSLMDKPLGDKEEEKERVIKELKRIEGEIEAIFKKN